MWHTQGKNILDSNCSSPICSVVSKSTRLTVLQCALTATEREFIIEGDKNTLVQWMAKRRLRINVHWQITPAKREG
jgi:hypothetical protein